MFEDKKDKSETSIKNFFFVDDEEKNEKMINSINDEEDDDDTYNHSMSLQVDADLSPDKMKTPDKHLEKP